jgi:glycosyltransferase involved in cell wall biosynthesis
MPRTPSLPGLKPGSEPPACPPISAIVIAKNEASRLPRCLEALTWTDEIVVVVDASSIDGTAAVARGFTPKVFERDWAGYVAQKEFAVVQARNDWVLWIDADEVVPAALVHEIQAALVHTDMPGFALPRRHIFIGAWLRYGGAYPDYNVRLFDRRRGRFDGAGVHELVVVDGPVGYLRTPLDHYSTPSLAQRVAKMNAYTDLDVPATVSVWRDLFLEPARRFLLLFVRRRGYRDAIPGYVWAVCSSFELFLQGAKAWEAQRRK